MPSAQEFWLRAKERIHDMAKLPMLAFLVVTRAMLAWLGIWFVFRCVEYLFQRFLAHSWIF